MADSIKDKIISAYKLLLKNDAHLLIADANENVLKQAELLADEWSE